MLPPVQHVCVLIQHRLLRLQLEAAQLWHECCPHVAWHCESRAPASSSVRSLSHDELSSVLAAAWSSVLTE